MTINPELLPAITEAGWSDAVAPLGTPETLSATVSAEPALTAVDIVLVLPVVCAMVRLDGEALMVKSFTVMATFTDIECVLEPSVPVTVIV